MQNLIDPLKELAEYNELLTSIKEYRMPVGVFGPSESQKAHISSALCLHSGQKGLYVAFNEMQARKFHEDFSFFFGEDVLFFPNKEIMLHDIEAKSNDAVYQRVKVLDRMLKNDFRFIVTSVEAISHLLVNPGLFSRSVLHFNMSSRFDLAALSRKLVMMGYERVDTVEGIGQFSIRGGILDVFSINSEAAVRIEFFDDEVDSIRQFDTATQRSIGKLAEAVIIPCREAIYEDDRKESVISAIQKDFDQYRQRLEGARKSRRSGNDEAEDNSKHIIRKLSQKLDNDIDRMNESHYFAGIDRYIHYIMDQPGCFTDYVGDDTLIFMDEPSRQRQRIENLHLENNETCRGLIEKGVIMPESQHMFFDYDDILQRLDNKKTVTLSTFNTGVQAAAVSKTYNITSRLLGSFQGHIEMLFDSVRDWKAGGNRVVILSGTKGRGERLSAALKEHGLDSSYSDSIEKLMKPGQVVIIHGSLNKGFEYPAIKLVILSDKEAFGQDRRAKKAAVKQKGAKINLFADLKVGDYVVHQAHGIGQYVGIEQLSVEGVKRDYLKIQYKDNGFLYIPTNQLDLIQKYIGSENSSPRLSKLGGTEWAKAKKKVKESLKELAGELLKIYARRQEARGFAFSLDTVWQNQFEEQFPYEETDSQLKCIAEIKQDMESGKLMDRLLCGDVGFGKTEVAIRAIFKAAMDGKQAAYLVPTTVLAQQHFTNFLERMKDFPVKVDVMSRFRTPADQRRVLRELKAGSIDILVGTHRLLQKDIQFRDLGLLVIDEEQRFGVGHKEMLKEKKADVHVLTLTATPIPRTLHMSLVGIRDISVLEDPPEERYPVQTYVMEYNQDVIRDAINRELSRKGQVFYLYNRVRTIDIKASEIQALVPDARVAVAHGQMEGRELEDIMYGFIKDEYDVLVCSTIIESGLDMPNVNTIIVEDADRMGLAQLYQLRGRVGRSNRLAYAYITYKKDKVVSEVAEKRLQAIREFTELGSGFKIAMRDMEIRGAGNLLGPEQHGHMESVGYDMYCRLLDEAVRELKGEPVKQADEDTAIDINLSAYIDNTYIEVETQKIEMYKKIASIQDEQDAVDIVDELTDRYGDIPKPVYNLISISTIKAMAGQLGFSSVTEKNDAVIFQIRDSKKVNIEVIGKLAAKYKRQLLFNAGNSPYIMYKIGGMERDRLLENIKIVLQDVKCFEVR